MVNKVILIGNLGKDPEIRVLENGAKVARFSVATNENYKDRDGNWQTLTEWHDVVAWRSQADKAEQTLKKGFPVYVEGKLTTRTWQDQDGNNRRTTEVVANYVRSLAKSNEGSSYPSNPMPDANDEPPFGNTSSPTPQHAPVEEAADDDLPF
ncbi:MAG: single-stranded DNA-binding protein [Saprospiraceae bacterium]|nr:single-stranded DNA-binding protein [Saprospiraceae bacterium]